MYHLRIVVTALCAIGLSVSQYASIDWPAYAAEIDEQPFGPDFPKLDSHATGRWWETKNAKLNVARDQVIAFALYTHEDGRLKLTGQLFPLRPEEDRTLKLEFLRDGQWREAAEAEINPLGWSAHFRIENWDNTQDVRYRLKHGPSATLEGRIRRDPRDKQVIVVGTLSCNSSRTPGPRPQMIENLKKQDPDLLFFAGDQSYHHTQHTFGWLEFGMQFRDVLCDRPVITIPDDHDVGQANIWGKTGRRPRRLRARAAGSTTPRNTSTWFNAAKLGTCQIRTMQR